MVSPFVSDEHREAFARYGRAHYAIQTLEYELVNTYGVLSLLPVFRLAKMTPISGISASKNDPLSLRL